MITLNKVDCFYGFLNKVDYEKEDEERLVMVCKLRILLLFIKFTIKRRNERYETISINF